MARITISQMQFATVEVAQHDFEAIDRIWTVQFEIHGCHWVLLIFFLEKDFLEKVTSGREN